MQEALGQVRPRPQSPRVGELDPDHEAASPQLSHVPAPIGHPRESVQQPAALALRGRDQVLVVDDLERSESGGAGDGVTSVCPTV